MVEKAEVRITYNFYKNLNCLSMKLFGVQIDGKINCHIYLQVFQIILHRNGNIQPNLFSFPLFFIAYENE
jgi:hypothetical protein